MKLSEIINQLPDSQVPKVRLAPPEVIMFPTRHYIKGYRPKMADMWGLSAHQVRMINQIIEQEIDNHTCKMRIIHTLQSWGK